MLTAEHPNPAEIQGAWIPPGYLEELRLNDTCVWAELVELYLVDARSHLVDLEQQTMRNYADATARTLHSLKGSSRQIGAERFGGQIEDMEIYLEAHAAADASQFLSGLHLAFEALRAEMNEAILALGSRQNRD